MKRITQFILCIVLAVSAYGQGVGGNSVPRTVSGISAALDLISSTQGTVFYRGASGWEALPPGTSGQLFSTQGAAANPIWVTATGGAGDVNGPTLGTATDNAIVRFDGTGGKTVQNSAVTIADTTGAMTWSGDATLSGGSSGAGTVSIGKASDGRIVLTPGSTMLADYEYVDIRSTTASGALAGDSFGLRSLFTINASAVGFHSAAILGQVDIPSGNAVAPTQYLAGLYGYITHNGSGTMSEAIGAHGVISTYGTGDITEANAFRANLSQSTGTGRMVTARNFYGPAFVNPAAATKPTLFVGYDAADYGVDGGLATTVYAFRSLGNTPSLLSGPVTVGSLSTGSTIVSSGIADASGVSTGMIQTLGGGSFAKQVWVGTRLVIDNAATGNSKGIDFGNGAYIYRNQSGGIRIDTTNQLYVQGDVVPTPTASYDIGGSSLKWRNAHFAGTVNTGTVSSAAGSNLVIGTGTFGTALTFTSATGAATFAGAVSVSGTTATWTSGTGSPESVKTAPVGSLYTRTDGGASTTLYVKESGAGNTGWVAK